MCRFIQGGLKSRPWNTGEVGRKKNKIGVLPLSGGKPPIKTAGKPTTHKQGISLDLQARLDKVREEYRKGNYVSCSTKEELTAFLEAL